MKTLLNDVFEPGLEGSFKENEIMPCMQGWIQDFEVRGAKRLGYVRGRGEHITSGREVNILRLGSWGYYLETDPDPIAMVIRVELVIHKPTETNAN